MTKRSASDIAGLLVEFGRHIELRGGNPYRARAYQRGAENLLAVATPLPELIAQDRLREIPGVGAAIAALVAKLYSGTHPALETMREEFPSSGLEMLSIPGLRPDKVMRLYKELGISSMAELEKAARKDRLKAVKGFGPALQAKILQGIEIRRKNKGQLHVHRAAEMLAAAKADLRRSRPDAKRIASAGDFRRGCELVSDLVLVAELPAQDSVARQGGSENVAVHLTDAAHYGVTLLFATGSKQHIAALRAEAREQGLTLTAQGLKKGRKLVASTTEEAIYSGLGLPLIPPELRETGNEVQLAKRGEIPRLVKDEDIRGIVHAHTERSDGVHTLEQMAKATRDRGFSYLGLTNHSQAVAYAGGLTIEEVIQQQSEIARLNQSLGDTFRIFKGIESDILADGPLDYPPDILARFDFIVASVHSKFRLGRAEQTERILRAVANPFTTILGHMTGRQLLRRPGYEVDIDEILTACARYGVAVEINANPWRLDLDWRWYRRALELGCLFSIDADAHSTSEIDLTHWGVVIARKGGVPADRVLNCLKLAEFRRYLETRKQAAARHATGRPEGSRRV